MEAADAMSGTQNDLGIKQQIEGKGEVIEDLFIK